MAIRVYNTLTRKKETFTPSNPDAVRVYVCGITPYSESHIGHSRFAVFWDVVRRYLEYKGHHVLMVQNLTDVEDKLIVASREERKPPMVIARRYSNQFNKDLARLGVMPAQLQPRASEHIDDIIPMIKALVEKGHAYAVSGDVYFDVNSFPGYGKLSGRQAGDVMAGARVDVDERKRDPRDFALWKAAKPGEPSWPSPWGAGRPGWHIECSAMSLKYLGRNFDFHGGGTDLIFPHHENEIAQSEAFLGAPEFARYWVHHEMLNLRQEKMSKSLGNVVTMRAVLDRFPGPAVRYFLLSTHYRKILEFGFELLAEATKGWERLQKSTSDAASYLWALGWRSRPATKIAPAIESGLARNAREARAAFEEFMDDDFNTAGAVGVLFDLATKINTAAASLSFNNTSKQETDAFGAAVGTLLELGGVLGLVEKPRFEPSEIAKRVRPVWSKWTGRTTPPSRSPARELREMVRDLAFMRQDARAKKQWPVADGIRNELGAAGIVLEDSRNGYRWRPEVGEVWKR